MGAKVNLNLLFLLCFVTTYIFGSKAARICAPKECLCEPITKNSKFRLSGLECVPARDRTECIELLFEGKVDITITTGNELYLAHLLFPQSFLVVGETRDKEFSFNKHRYEGVAVVRRSTIKSLDDLRQSNSCHTGYWRTAGWHIPMTNLKAKGLIKQDCDPNISVVEQDLKDISEFFKQVCLPGDWAPDKDTDSKLKSKYITMCDACGSFGSTRCTKDDAYSGYEGALQCLLNNADVAWTKYSEVLKFFSRQPSQVIDEYGLLCPDGRVLDITSGQNEVTNCAWGGRPWDAWIVRTEDKSKSGMLDQVKSLITAVNNDDIASLWAKDTLGSSGNSVLQSSKVLTPKQYLKDMNFLTTYTDVTTCDKPSVKMCVEGFDAKQKCQLLSKNMEAARIRPLLDCIMPDAGDVCLDTVAQRASVITTLDGAEVYKGHKTFDTKAIVTEKYGESDASYYAVAVVKKDSGITSFEHLKSKTSCHTGYGKTSGWKMPVATLLEKQLIPSGSCNYAEEVAKFFYKSCVPGAKDLTNIGQADKDSLCQLCVGLNDGTKSSKCSKNSDEVYYGYTGAFRCLVEKGDVAFIKHTTVLDNTDGRNTDSWAKNLKKSQFVLLCPNGGTAAVSDYKTCNLERVPAHKVVIGPKSSELDIEEVRIQLLRASNSLKNRMSFLMFGTFNSKKDLIFKNSATSLNNIPSDDIHTNLQEGYNKKLEELGSCGPIASGSRVSVLPLTVVLIAVMSLLIM